MRVATPILALGLLAGALAAQGTLDAGLAPASPRTFSTVSGGSAPLGVVITGADNVLLSEALQITLTTVPTPPVPPPGQLLPRRVQLWLGAEAGPPLPSFLGPIFINPGLTPFPVTLIDSFTHPFDPIFGPPLQGPSNVISLTWGVDLFPPPYVLPLPPLVLQAIAEDTPGNGLLLSGGVRFLVIDPEVGGFAPAITGWLQPMPASTCLDPTHPVPVGPEAGGNTAFITGLNFPAQTLSAALPPTITFDGVPAGNVVIIDNQTVRCTVPGTACPTTPPTTCAGPVVVAYRNHPAISPAGTFVNAPTPYMYDTGTDPVLTGFSNTHGRPEGGQTRIVNGSWMLDGQILRFRSLANPMLVTDLVSPTVTPGPGGLFSMVVTPPFCTGPVSVRIFNVDGRCSGVVNFDYDEQPPVIAAVTPTFHYIGTVPPTDYPLVEAVGASVTVTGADYIGPASPLFGAPTVPQNLVYETRVQVAGVPQPSVVPLDAGTLQGPTVPIPSGGLFRPELGFHPLTVENPPCLRTGNQGPISASTPVLIQSNQDPMLSMVFPAVGVNFGGTQITLTGGNYFSRVPNVTEQDFSLVAPPGSITSLALEDLQVPAVRFEGVFGSFFSPFVRMVNANTLEVIVPQVLPAINETYQIRVFNPDGRWTVVTQDFEFVPTLVDPTTFLDPNRRVLNADLLKAIITSGGLIVPGDPLTSPAILSIINPSPTADKAADPARGLDPRLTNARYELVLLLNTRRDLGNGMSTTRLFAFDRIDLPATITLDVPGIAFQPTIDPTIQSGATIVPPGIPFRVILKACAFELLNERITFDPTLNPPLVLESHDDFTVDAMIDVAGDALYPEDFLVASLFRRRVDRTIPPAAAGYGGRGGAYFPEGALTMPAPNFGATGVQLTGGVGGEPTIRRATVMPAGTGGGKSPGSAPIALTVGSAAGGGYTTAGGTGDAGPTVPDPGGATFGNASAMFMVPPAGIPPDDRLIFGGVPADYGLFDQGTTVIETGLFYGGSAGGGGGGGVALVAAAIALGGRGGHAGGCVLLLSNRVMSFGTAAFIDAHGEQGVAGVDAFPIPDGPTTIPICVPGAGGSGTGGTVFGLAVTTICFAYGTDPTCPGGMVTPVPSRPVVNVRGAPQGPAPSPGLAPGSSGAGGSGRIRFAVNQISPYVGPFTTSLDVLFTQGVLAPTPPNLTPANLPDYYRFLSN